MKFYTLELNIRNKKCVVVGGGEIARRKITSLLECGGEVHVVSRELSGGLKTFLRAGKICFYEKEYESGDIEGAFLVIAATDCPETNKRIAQDARKLKILVNVTDNIELCDYLVPAITRVGDLTISVSTAGKSPFLAKKIRNEIAKCYGEEYGELLSILGGIRDRVRKEVIDFQKRKLVWKSIINSKVIELIKEGALDKVNVLINEVIKKHKE